MTPLDALAAAGGGLAAGLINAVAGGGTLVSFPILVALGVPTVSANVTNTVALCPGYLGGAYAQRDDLRQFAAQFRALMVAAAVGGLLGSILVVVTSESVFRAIVPFLILTACALLIVQQPLRNRLASKAVEAPSSSAAPAWAGLAVFAAAVYGGYFGAGLGIMLLAVLGLAFHHPLPTLNALKQALALVVNVMAALFLVWSGKVHWGFAAVMAPASLIGGSIGGRVANRLNPTAMRIAVVCFGVAVAIRLLID